MTKALAGVLAIALGGVAWASDKAAQNPDALLAQAEPRVQQDYDRTERTVYDGQPKELNKATNLIGCDVKNPQGDDLGNIRDIVINLENEEVSYVVMGSGGVLGIGEKLLAVPLSALSLSPDGEHLVLQADEESIDRAEGIGDDEWPTVEDPDFGAIPFWKEHEETD